MNDSLPPLPPYAPEFKPRWPTDPGGYNEDQMKAYARAAIERQSVPAGWMLVPIEPSEAMTDATYAGQHCSDIWRDMIAAAPQLEPVQQFELTEYDAGLLNDFGGGNVEWWQDYIRAELGRAYEHYQSQIPAQGEKQ